MADNISVSNGSSAKVTLKKVLILSGIISSLFYVAINIIVPTQFPGYSSVSQTVSELSAIDAPTRPLWVFLCTFYSLLVIAFGWGIRISAGGNQRLQTVAVLMLIYGISGFFWPPMHLRGNEPTMTDTIHIVFSIVTVIMMLLMIGFGAASFGKRFRYFSIFIIAMLILFGALTGMDGPKIAANLPTPLVGVWERISIGFFLLWVIVLAVVLMYAEKKTETISV